jgi:hypothetical protein
MNRLERNLFLLKDDIISPIKSFMLNRGHKKLIQKAAHKKEIIYLYRHMLKTIPPMQETLLLKRRTYEVRFLNNELRK